MITTADPQSPSARRTRTSTTVSPDSSPIKPKSKGTRRTTSLPSETVDYLKDWMMSPEHIAHPYPTEKEKAQIMADTGIELKQLTNWFVNNRKRFWKPRVEARLQQQAQVAAAAAQVTPTSGIHVLNSEALASLERSVVPRAVSISSGSDSDNSSFSNDLDNDVNGDVVMDVDSESQTVKRTETIDVHILRPTEKDALPSLEDVTILTNVPSDRITKTYENCTMSYRIPFACFGDKKKTQSRRDAEIVKIKKQYLKKYLAETADSFDAPSPFTMLVNRKRSRSESQDEDAEPHGRPKYLRKCANLWHEVCLGASHGYDRELPSLEEASHLFGYSSQ